MGGGAAHVHGGRAVEQLGLARVDALEQLRGVALLAELDRVAVVREDLLVRDGAPRALQTQGRPLLRAQVGCDEPVAARRARPPGRADAEGAPALLDAERGEAQQWALEHDAQVVAPGHHSPPRLQPQQAKVVERQLRRIVAAPHPHL